MAEMDLFRLQDLSLYFFLDDLFSAYDHINVEDGYPDEELELPVISVEAMPMDLTNFELGNRDKKALRRWTIDVFAKNKAMRDEFAYKIVRALPDGVNVYNYNEGFPPDVSPSLLGGLSIGDINVAPVRIFPRIQERLYWRMNITFSTTYNEF